MKVLYEKSFLKDLRKCKDAQLKERVNSIIVEVKEAESLASLHKAEKLKGHPVAYKIRIGSYRCGFFIENDAVIFSRFLHRKDIYRKFP
jgi:mRNA interferase RelE/StbE